MWSFSFNIHTKYTIPFPFAHTYAQQPIETNCVLKLQKFSHDFYTMPVFLCLFLLFFNRKLKGQRIEFKWEKENIWWRNDNNNDQKDTWTYFYPEAWHSDWNECTIRLKWLRKKVGQKCLHLRMFFQHILPLPKGKIKKWRETNDARWNCWTNRFIAATKLNYNQKSLVSLGKKANVIKSQGNAK